MRRKHLIALFAFVGLAMICSSAEPFHQHPANPDRQARAEHAVNKDCRVLQRSNYHTAKAILAFPIQKQNDVFSWRVGRHAGDAM